MSKITRYQKASLLLELVSRENKPTIKGSFKEIVLTNYSEKELTNIDPQLVILAPLTIDRKTEKRKLKEHCGEWLRKAYEVYEPGLHRDVVNVLHYFYWIDSGIYQERR